MMKYKLYFLFCLLIFGLLGLYGCNQTPTIPKDDVPLRISEEKDSTPPKTEATPETLHPEILKEPAPPSEEPAEESPTETDTESEPPKSEQPKSEQPESEQSKEQKEPSSPPDQSEVDVPAANPKQDGCPLAEDVHSLCVLPDDAFSNNPQQIDPIPYAIFKNVMQELLAREKGTITVEILNNGKRSIQELKYDISNAVGEDGKIDPSKEIEASLEYVDTIQSNMYATNARENFEEYRSYQNLMKKMVSPLIQESFLPEHLDSVTYEIVDDVITITAPYTVASMEKLSQQALADAENTTVFMEITTQSEIISVTVEQTNGNDSSTETVSRLYYTFA